MIALIDSQLQGDRRPAGRRERLGLRRQAGDARSPQHDLLQCLSLFSLSHVASYACNVTSAGSLSRLKEKSCMANPSVMLMG